MINCISGPLVILIHCISPGGVRYFNRLYIVSRGDIYGDILQGGIICFRGGSYILGGDQIIKGGSYILGGHQIFFGGIRYFRRE